jgi:hypothetical protein
VTLPAEPTSLSASGAPWGLNKCPQTRFPYEQLVEGNGRRSLDQLADRNDVRW